MGHRVYLIKSNEVTSAVLFEANNILPFFWLTLIREKDLDDVELAMREAYQHMSTNTGAPETARIRVAKQVAITNGQATYPFMEENFPDRLQLYRDFIGYLDKNIAENEVLILDTFALSAIEGIDPLIHFLKEELNALDMFDGEKMSDYFNDGDITTLTGHGAFPGENAATYAVAYKSIPPELPDGEELRAVNKTSLPAAISVIVAGAILLYVPYKGYLKEGITLAMAFCGLIALIVLIMGCRRLLAAIRK
ncbi:hypothetical protein ACDQ55_15040 [Chitinophaga sp. 30R24]|uniref:hypothetical protein n=1 Tax=Chitinophaga sp. 30R24 TaxID=3248838 RepID=UPI003B918D19